jgi:uncharacterized protein YqgC (DUF456 family)
MDGVTVVAGLIMLVGLIGIVVPVLPGVLLVWAAVLIWALDAQTPAGWVVLGIATTLALSGFVLRYLLPGRRMAASGVTMSSIVAGVALGVAGFFLIPVLGAFLGFPLGIYLAERVKRHTHAAAWSSTKHALKAIGLSMGIELMTGLAIATTWLIGVAASA